MFSILIVEDDFSTRKLMSVVLKNAGFCPIPAENSSEALELFEEKKPDQNGRACFVI